ncbi:MAG: hypothetical protein GTO53_03245 [Planctomycetales bacterium]|nr:hypothetical protein [Planctomycetales bacterium]NIM08180.1 hypothetical protein [Planctomycetales bacterium]NIN07677.1 hypothetical protein [Planctomycetales bacterium]NIN76794.1 hypothetical protein [Planctomycetales bacterium]NIO33999.1 hypothetical protein [Planctomycetales bacterium]
MWRALFLAIGIFICLIGLQCLVIEEAVFANLARPTTETNTLNVSEPAPRGHVVNPPDWAPWAFLGGGAVVILYSFTIPRRMRG